jgi:hypothetical protein
MARSRFTFAPAVLVGLGAGLLAGSAGAQQPSQAQIAAIRSACPSDFRAKCAGVTPGGADALACLRGNVGTLSPASMIPSLCVTVALIASMIWGAVFAFQNKVL